MTAFFRNYAARAMLCAALLCVASVLVIIIVDPLDTFRIVKKPGFNQVKTKLQRYERIAKPIQISQLKPRTLILGSSRSEYGINPRASVFGEADQPVFNGAVSAGAIGDLEALIRQGVHGGNLGHLLIGIDFFMFNGFNSPPFPYPELIARSRDDNWLVLRQMKTELLSLDFLRASFSTLRGQDEPMRIDELGWRNNDRKIASNLKKGGMRAAFQALESNYVEKTWTPCRDGQFPYRIDGQRRSTLERFADAMAFALGEGVDVTLFLPPIHARMLAALQESGLWPAYVQWRQDMLVLLNSLQKEESSRIRLFDFTLVNEMTTEMVPPSGDRQSRMRWYIDSAHYSEPFGSILLDIMYQGQAVSSGSEERSSLVYLPTLADEPRHMASLADALDQWREKYPSEAKEVRGIVQAARQYRAEQGVVCNL